MLYNLSNNDGNRIVQTNELIGKKFGLIERLMLNGVKSSRLTVSESSHEIQKIIQSGQHIVFSDIEMIKKGGVNSYYLPNRKMLLGHSIL